MAIIQKSFSDLVDFSRASTATYFDDRGVMQTAGVNEPRFDHDPATGEARGLLVEGQATNLFTWSNDFTNSVWEKSNVTVVEGSVSATDGSMMTKIVENLSSGEHFIGQIAQTPPLSTVWMGVFVKAGERKKVRLNTMIFAGQESRTQMVVDLTTGQFTLSGVGDYEGRVTDVGNGIYLAQVRSIRNDDPGSFSSRLNVSILNDNGDHIYQGDGVSGIYIAHAQLEVSPLPTSYIPTEGSQVTRVSDNPSGPITLALSGNTFVTDVVVDAPFTTQADERRHLYTLAKSTDTNFVLYIYLESRGLYAVSKNGISSTLITRRINEFYPATGVRYRIAVALDGDNAYASVNGGVVSQTSTPLTQPEFDTFYLGTQNGVTRELNGKMARFTQYQKRLTDAELQEITS